MGTKTDVSTTKYEIIAKFTVDGIVEKPDIIGALYGQTDGLLSEDLDIRELQKLGKIGRIHVEHSSTEGKTTGTIVVPTSLSRVETAILAATLESIDRVGPCGCSIVLQEISDVRINKRKSIVNRAAEIIRQWNQNVSPFVSSLTTEVQEKSLTQIKAKNSHTAVVSLGTESSKITAGKGFEKSKKVILVEGRADVLNLFKFNIDNTIAVDGTNIPPNLPDLIKNKTVTAFLDGDRGGDLILKELLQVAHVNFVARAPEGKEVEDLNSEEVKKALEQAKPIDQTKFLTGEDKGLTVKEFLVQSKQQLQQPKRPHIDEDKDKQRKIERPQRDRDSRERPQRDRDSRERPQRDRDSRERPQRDRDSRERPQRDRDSRERPPRGQQRSFSDRDRRPSRDRAQDTRGSYRQREEVRKVHLPENLSKAVEEVKQKLEAIALTETEETILRTPVKQLYDELDKLDKAKTLIVDGIATERLLERAYKKGIALVICARLGEITKKPATLRIVQYNEIK